MAQASYNAAGIKAKGQTSHLRNKIWTDVHGRRWWSSTHAKDESQAPACPPEPIEWTAPVIPDSKYLSGSQDPMDQNKLLIDYTQWQQDLMDAQTDWNKRADVYAIGLAQGDEQVRQKLTLEPSFAMLQYLGPKPLDPKYVLACQAGDPWALGQTTVKPAWAKRLWPTTDPVVRGRSPVDLSFLDEPDLVEPPKTAGKGK